MSRCARFSDWNDPAPGHIEADLVSHSGPVAKGSFVHTLVLTDIATGWTECAPLLVREQRLLTEVLGEARKLMPFPLLGFDTDNDSVFMNETVQVYCKQAGVVFTRCRPYRKNDQAWVEQKNGAIVRHMVGYRRFEGLEAAATLAELYRSVRLFVNFFQPSFKLADKEREGAKVRKRYHPPATPLSAAAGPIHERQRRPGSGSTLFTPPSIPSDFCRTSAPCNDGSSKLPTRHSSTRHQRRSRRRWSSSCPGSARPGGKPRFARRPGRRKKPSERDGDPTRSRR